MKKLYDLWGALVNAGLINTNDSLQMRYERAVKLPVIREILDLQTPQIYDWNDLLGITGDGRVLVVRMDLTPDINNHKKLVVGGLILRRVLQGYIPKAKIDTLIDGGNFNSASALRFYVRRFGLRGMYVMSYLFPSHITDFLEAEDFQVIQPPHKPEYEHAREREFYEFLFERMKDKAFRENKCCLWHAKYGGEVMYPFGREIARSIRMPINCTVSCLGAGSTLEGIQLAIADELGTKTIIAEHELSPLFAKKFEVQAISDEVIPLGLADPGKYLVVPQLPHTVIGPHYDEINPLLPFAVIKRVSGVIQFNEAQWQATQAFLAQKGISIGNSSAANVSVAWRLANQGQRVLTLVFEPFREFLLKR